jgi:hypothetical protein
MSEDLEVILEDLSQNEERRRFPRVLVDLPLDYWDKDHSSLHGGIVVNASEGGLLVESLGDIPIGKGINISVLFRNEYELTNLKAMAEIVWKKPYWKKTSYWNGYHYGMRLTKILDEDRSKLGLLLDQGFSADQFPDKM